MRNKLIKHKKKLEKLCKLCKAKFDIWISDMDFTEEKRERMGNYFRNFECPVCKCLPNCAA